MKNHANFEFGSYAPVSCKKPLPKNHIYRAALKQYLVRAMNRCSATRSATRWKMLTKTAKSHSLPHPISILYPSSMTIFQVLELESDLSHSELERFSKSM